ERLGTAAERFAPGRRLARDEDLDLTAGAKNDVEKLALSSTARPPVRVTIEVPRDEVDELAALLAEAQHVIETLRQGLGSVPHSLPEGALGERWSTTPRPAHASLNARSCSGRGSGGRSGSCSS